MSCNSASRTSRNPTKKPASSESGQRSDTRLKDLGETLDLFWRITTGTEGVADLFVCELCQQPTDPLRVLAWNMFSDPSQTFFGEERLGQEDEDQRRARGKAEVHMIRGYLLNELATL